jgi:transcriptional adapter 2-alpha
MRPRDEREMIQLLRPLQQFSSKEDHEQLVRGCIDEHRLRKKIEQLKGYLAQGLKTKADIEVYEAKKRRKE